MKERPGACKPSLATAVFCFAFGVVGCAPAQSADAPASPSGTSRPQTAAVGAGREGSLRQDQISVRMTAGELRIEVTPLASWVLEAAAPDTRRRLERVAAAHRSELALRAGDSDAVLFLVSFSSERPADFVPEDLHIVSRGVRERPAAIVPVTPAWGERRLPRRATAMAVYAYGPVDLSRELLVAYQGSEDSSWTRVLAVIEAERARLPGGL